MKVLGVLLLVSFVLAEPPYPPSGWKPAGERLQLPIKNLRQQAPVPHTVYGPPSSTEAPQNGYLPPDTGTANEGAEVEQANPQGEYGPPAQEPDNGYGPPAQQPDNGYGPPAQQPSNGYGAPAEEPNNGYGAPDPAPQPDNGYGAPAQQPDNGYPNNNYGPPQEQPEEGYAPAQQPDDSYGAPEQPTNEYGPPQDGYPPAGPPPQQPDYEVPQEGSGQLDPGASERLRQNQFVQQLPLFESVKFRPRQRLQSQRLRQQTPQRNNVQQVQRGNLQRQPQQAQRGGFQQQQRVNFQQPLRNGFQQQQAQRFTSPNVQISRQQLRNQQSKKSQRLQSLDRDVESFDTRQKLPKTTSNQLYATSKPPKITTSKPPKTTQSSIDVEQEDPNIAVSTAVAGQYYVLQQDGLLQRVTYKVRDGQLTDGQIISNLRYSDVRPINAPVYGLDEQNRLVYLLHSQKMQLKTKKTNL